MIVERVGSGLAWGLKDSFVAYIRRTGGQVRVGATSGTLPGGEFYFGLTSSDLFDRRQGRGVLVFEGAIGFSAHGGLLSLDLADPWVTIGKRDGQLSISMKSRTGERRIPLAALDVGQGRVGDSFGSVLPIPAALCPEGAALFDDMYPPGEPLSPLHIRI